MVWLWIVLMRLAFNDTIIKNGYDRRDFPVNSLVGWLVLTLWTRIGVELVLHGEDKKAHVKFQSHKSSPIFVRLMKNFARGFFQ